VNHDRTRKFRRDGVPVFFRPRSLEWDDLNQQWKIIGTNAATGKDEAYFMPDGEWK
jgi:hypothetical protein